MGAPVKESDLRAAKGELVGRIADQQRAVGAMPDTRSAEQYLDPLVEKVARDTEAAPEPRQVAQDPSDSEGMQRRGNVAEVSLAAHEMGAKVSRVLDPQAFARRRRKTAQQLAWEVTARAIYKDPAFVEWRAKLDGALYDPAPGHGLAPCTACASKACMVREQRLMAVCAEFWRAHGNPVPTFRRALAQAAAKQPRSR